jgi:Mg2+ and Co2+ transporter CorA
MNKEDLVYRLRKRAEIRRQIPTRKSVQEGATDRIADLLEEAAHEIENLEQRIVDMGYEISDMGYEIAERDEYDK